MSIRQQLMQFQTSFTITYSPPGFIIETASAPIPLQLLGCRSLDGEGFVLDLVPWCFEYESSDLPWIIADDAEGKIRRPLPTYVCAEEIGFFLHA